MSTVRRRSDALLYQSCIRSYMGSCVAPIHGLTLTHLPLDVPLLRWLVERRAEQRRLRLLELLPEVVQVSSR